MLSGEKKYETLPSLKEDFMSLFFGDKANNATPLHILYTTAKFPSYRNEQITRAYKNNRTKLIDLSSNDKALFIQRCAFMDQLIKEEGAEEKPISTNFVMGSLLMEMTFHNPKEALIELYKKNQEKTLQLEDKNEKLKQIVNKLSYEKSMNINEIADFTGLDTDTVKEYLQ